MGYAGYVGRIGALAVALGVGSAIAFPQVTWADDDAAGADAAPASASVDGGPTPSGTSDAGPVAVPIPSAPVADGDGPSTTVAVGASPPVTISAQTVESTPPKRRPEPKPDSTHGENDSRDASPAEVDAHRETPWRTTTAAAQSDPAPAPRHTALARAATVTTAAPASAVTVAAPTASVAVTTVTPPQAPAPLAPVRTLVLGVLGVFGFTPNPAPGTVDNPILEVLWGAYRRIESVIGNGPPTAGTASVVGTSLTTDGKVAVTLTMGFTDPEGAPLTYTTTGGTKGTLTANPDGTYTYLTDAGSAGTDTVAITATDTGFHLDRLFGVSHSRTATLAITLTAAANASPVIDSVTSTPGIGNTWTVAVSAHDPEGAAVTTGLSAADPAHVTITDEGGGTYTVNVTDAAWALAHPGTQITVTATVSDGESAPATRTSAIGTVANTVSIGGGDYYGLASSIPALPAGVTYTRVSAGVFRLALLRSDSQIVIVAPESTTVIPAPPDGVTYTQIAAGGSYTVVLRSDGTALGVGTAVPDPPDGLSYTGVAAGDSHTVLLRSDGQAVAFGWDDFGQTDVPELPAGVTYTGAAAGFSHTVLLRSDGTAVAIGKVFVEDVNSPLGGELEDIVIPTTPAGVTYTGVAAGHDITVLLRSDGTAIGLGHPLENSPIPELPDGLTYTLLTSSGRGAVLVRSDGSAFTLPYTGTAGTALPAPPTGVSYLQGAVGGGFVVALTTVDSTRPVPTVDSVSTSEDTPLALPPHTLLGNDVDPNDAALTIIGAGQGGHGTTSVAADGTITYTPDADFNGTDTFTYTVTNGSQPTLGSVVVTITPVSDAPVITAVESTPGINNTWTVTVATHDADGDPVTTGLSAADPLHVAVTASGNGSYTVSVTDTAWAFAHPGAQITVTATASDGIETPAAATLAVGTVSNAMVVGRGTYWDPLNSLPPDIATSDIPALPAGVTYTRIAGQRSYVVLLRSDGNAVTAGRIWTPIPAPIDGVTYTAIAAGADHFVLLRSDGTAVAFGTNYFGQTDIPALPDGLTYTAIAAGAGHTVLLRSDGTAVAVGDADYGALEIPPLEDGVTYVQAAGGPNITALLRSDGTAVAVGDDRYGQTDIPPADGFTYTAVSIGFSHTVLLRSDGTAVGIGTSAVGETDIPPPPAGVGYTEVDASTYYTFLLSGAV